LRIESSAFDDEVGRARRYPAATASLIIVGIILLISPKLVASLFGWTLFGVPAGLVFVGLFWVFLIGLSWLSQHFLAPLILDREGVDTEEGEEEPGDA